MSCDLCPECGGITARAGTLCWTCTEKARSEAEQADSLARAKASPSLDDEGNTLTAQQAFHVRQAQRSPVTGENEVVLWQRGGLTTIATKSSAPELNRRERRQLAARSRTGR